MMFNYVEILNKELRTVIKVYPDRVINFFTAPTNYFMTREAQTFYSLISVPIIPKD